MTTTAISVSNPVTNFYENDSGCNSLAKVLNRTWPIVLMAFFLRVGMIFYRETYLRHILYNSKIVPPNFGFGAETGSIARSLALGRGFSSPFGVESGPTAWIAPIYPSICAIVFKVFGVETIRSAIAILTINSLVSALTCILIYLIALEMFNKHTALISCWIWAVTPFFMRWPTTWIWEISFTAFLMGALFLGTLRLRSERPKLWIILGGAFGLSALVNPALLAVMPAALALPACRLRAIRQSWIKPVLFALVAAFVVMSPWLIRNYIVFHEPVFIRGNFGTELRIGNFHGAHGQCFAGRHPTANPLEMHRFLQLGEHRYVKWCKEDAMRFIRQNPREFARITSIRIVDFWSGGSLRYEADAYLYKPWMAQILSYGAFLGLAVALLRRIKSIGLIVGFLALYPMPYYVTYTSLRYRHALEPLLLILSVFAALVLIKMLKNSLNTIRAFRSSTIR